MLPTFILRKRVQALRPNAYLVLTIQIIGMAQRETYTVLDYNRADGYNTLALGWTARLAWKNALDKLRA